MARLLTPPAGTAPARLDARALAQALGIAWDHGWRTRTTWYDSEDRRLLAAGLLLAVGDGVWRLGDLQDRILARTEAAAAGAIRPAALPAGALRDRVLAAVGSRALIPLLTGEADGGSVGGEGSPVLAWTRVRSAAGDRVWAATARGGAAHG
ncbi:MAG: hypothetical protein RLZZ127_3181, partial [Planctomycetota bacterium]